MCICQIRRYKGPVFCKLYSVEKNLGETQEEHRESIKFCYTFVINQNRQTKMYP